jgi:hypothetical protein
MHGLALRHAAVLSPLPRWRLPAAAFMLGAAFAAALNEEGRAMGWDQALELAMSKTPSG